MLHLFIQLQRQLRYGTVLKMAKDMPHLFVYRGRSRLQREI